MGEVHSPGATYGWRARIGLLQPGLVSDTNPYEFYMMAPQGVQMLQTSLGVAAFDNENYERAVANLETPVKRLLQRHPDVLVQTGIPPLVLQGWGIEDKLKARVAELTPLPYVTDFAGSIGAMKAVDIKRVVVVSAFDEDVTTGIEAYLRHAGLTMVAHGDVGEEWPSLAGEVPLEIVYRVARRAFLANKADGIWITQASMPSVGVIADLERDLGVPVVSTSQSLMWAALRLAGIRDRIEGFGRLFGVPEFER